MTSKTHKGSEKNSKVSVKKHDEGLTKSERIFVHALRGMFNPKGKQRDVSMEPKGFVPAKKSNSGSRATQRETNRPAMPKGLVKKDKVLKAKLSERKAHLPPASNLEKWKHPFRTRRKVNAKRFEKDFAEKRQKTEKLTKSKLRRAEKRVILQITYAEKNGKAGTATAAQRIRNTLNDFQKMASAVPQRGIEVVQAFGGEQCLRMLGSISYRKEYSHASYRPVDPDRKIGRLAPEGFVAPRETCRKVFRDYTTIFIKGRAISSSEKNKLVHPVHKRQRNSEKKDKVVKPNAERLSKGKAKEKDNDKSKSAVRKDGASALRRKLKRRERVLEEMKSKPEKVIEIVSPEVIKTSVSGGGSAKDQFKDALNTLAEKQDEYFKKMATVITNRTLFEAWLKGTSPSSLRNNVAEYNKQLKALQVRIRWVASKAGVELTYADQQILRDIFK
jgi:hypothetical protein